MIFKEIAFIFAAFSLTEGVTIQCNFRDYDWTVVTVVSTQYSCYPATIIYDGNLTHVTEITGNHLIGKTNADVKAFYIDTSHQNLNRIPMGIETFFPDLLLLIWDFGYLTTLTADDLEPFPELQVFGVYGNKLISLDGDLFKQTPNLVYINFVDNRIEHVGFGLLDNLNNLTRADFDNNRCIAFYANTPKNIQELKLKLQNQCPPLATTSTSTSSTPTGPGQCSDECVELIATLEQKIMRQDERISALSDAILELEKQIRELWARS